MTPCTVVAGEEKAKTDQRREMRGHTKGGLGKATGLIKFSRTLILGKRKHNPNDIRMKVWLSPGGGKRLSPERTGRPDYAGDTGIRTKNPQKGKDKNQNETL